MAFYKDEKKCSELLVKIAENVIKSISTCMFLSVKHDSKAMKKRADEKLEFARRFYDVAHNIEKYAIGDIIMVATGGEAIGLEQFEALRSRKAVLSHHTNLFETLCDHWLSNPEVDYPLSDFLEAVLKFR